VNGRRIAEQLLSAQRRDGASSVAPRELDRMIGELFRAAAHEWKAAGEGRLLEHLERALDVCHTDLDRIFKGEKKLGGRLFLAPAELLAIFLRELRIAQLLLSGEHVEADVRGGNAQLVIALADLQAHDTRASADQQLTPDECKAGLTLIRAARAELERRERAYERGLAERGVARKDWTV
jgi:hypothetical protein